VEGGHVSEHANAKQSPSGLIKNRWVATAVSLLIGLGLGTTLGRNVLDTAGVPASCVRAIQRADTALATGNAVADNGKAALDAVKGLRLGEAGDLLGEVKNDATRFFGQAKRFNVSRARCKADRK
jgi:hypothetical protein